MRLHVYVCSSLGLGLPEQAMGCLSLKFEIGSRGSKLAEFSCSCVFSLSPFNVARDSMNIGLVTIFFRNLC